MKLLDLLKHINVFNVKNNHKIENITDSSESCTLNSIFVAIKGHKEDGNNFIDEAITKGAKTIVLSKRIKEQADINYIYVDDTKRIFAVLLYYFNEKYLNKVKLIGVVGTNGKSTTANNIFSMLNYFHRKASLIGTDGFIIEDKVIKHNNTTPHIFLLYEYIKMCVKNNVKYIVMELSSVAIAELRCHMLEYFILVFTNFNEDHLDYHKTIDDYFLHKRIPFIEMNKNSYAIINKDDSKYNSLIKHIKGRVISYSIKEESMYKAFILSYKAFMISFSVNNCNYIYNSIGIFNIYNLLPLFFINDLLNIDKDMFKTFIYNLKPPKGRMDVIKYKKSYIVVDYAHTESSVRNVINTVLGYTQNKKYVVIGCGGSRDKNRCFIKEGLHG